MPPANQFDNATFLQALAERTSQIIFAYHPATRQLLYLNPSFDEVWQKTREGVLADPASLIDTLHPEDKEFVLAAYAQMRQGEVKRDLEFRIQIPNHTHRWICLTPFLLGQQPDEQIVAGFAEDITARKEHADNLKKFAAKKNSLLEILSHDLAGPLGTIQGLTSLVVSRTKAYGNAELNELLNLIVETSKRSVHLIRDFVKQEFLESANVDIITKRVNLVVKVREVIEEYKKSEASIAKTFNFTVSEDPIHVDIDEVKFMQVINNLISNAIKFTPDGGIITIEITRNHDQVRITLADNGIGIPTELQDGLFEKFTKARRPGLKGEPSTGLGMSISKTIVEWHHGKIWFESKENQGTTFFIEIPEAK